MKKIAVEDVKDVYSDADSEPDCWQSRYRVGEDGLCYCLIDKGSCEHKC